MGNNIDSFKLPPIRYVKEQIILRRYFRISWIKEEKESSCEILQLPLKSVGQEDSSNTRYYLLRPLLQEHLLLSVVRNIETQKPRSLDKPTQLQERGSVNCTNLSFSLVFLLVLMLLIHNITIGQMGFDLKHQQEQQSLQRDGIHNLEILSPSNIEDFYFIPTNPRHPHCIESVKI